jgi:hypothetical protein
MADKVGRWPHPGKFSLALLEHLVEPVIGKDARAVLKEPAIEQQLRSNLERILLLTEQQFISECDDRNMTAALLNLPLADLSDIKTAVQEYYTAPDSLTLKLAIVAALHRDLPQIDPARLESTADVYLAILRRYLIADSSTTLIRDKLNALALQAIQSDAAKTRELMAQVLDVLNSWSEIQTRQPAFMAINLAPNWSLSSPSGIVMSSPSQFERLRSWLNQLTDQEYRDAIRIVLTVEEQNLLPDSVVRVNRGDFLGHLQQLGYFDRLEDYLFRKYSNRLMD